MTPHRVLWSVRSLRGRLRTDAALAGLAAAGVEGGVFLELRGSPWPAPPPAGAYLLGAAAAAALLARQGHAFAVSVAAWALALCYHLVGYPGLAPALALFFSLYALAAYRDRPTGLVAAGVLVACSTVITALPPHPLAVTNWAVIGPGLGLACVVAIGESVHARRVEADERVRRAEEAGEERAMRRLAEERLRVARELHDVLAHTITLITVQAGVAADALDGRPAEARTALAAIRAAAREATAEVGAALRVLRAQDGADQVSPPQPGLDGLDELAERARASGLRVEVSVEGARGPLPAPVDLAAYRIVQEALTNVVRHAGAESAGVRLRYLPDELVVEVGDDGRSAAPDALAGPGGHGLAGMRERVRSVGGTLQFGPVEPAGFLVRARLPFEGTPR